MKLRLDTSQGGAPSNQTAGNIKNGNPLISVSPRARKGGHRKRLAVYPTAANMRLLLPSFFILLFPTRMPLTVSQPITYGNNGLHTAPAHRQPRHPPGLSIGTLSIRYGQGFKLAQEIQAVEHGGFDMMMLIKTKIHSEAYSHNRLGFNVTCLTARPSSSGGDHGGVGLVTRERPVGWVIESMCYHGPNVVSCKIVTGLTLTPLVGAYVPPSTLEHLTGLQKALQRCRDPIFLGDLNMDLDKARSLHIQRV